MAKLGHLMLAIAVASFAASSHAQTAPPASSPDHGDAAGRNRLTIVVGPDGFLSLRTDVSLSDLAARVKAVLPDPAGSQVVLSVNGAVDLSRMAAIDDALRDAGVKSVLVVTGVTLRPPSEGTGMTTEPAHPGGPPPAPVAVRVDAAGAVFVDGAKTSLAELGSRLNDLTHGDHGTRVLLQGEPATAYGDMVKTMEAVLAAGFESVAILNDPASSKPPAGP